MNSWGRGRSLRLLLAACLATGGAVPALAAGGLTLLAEQPLPMAVRDGRIAEATARAVPFPLGGEALDAPTAAVLDGFLAAIATDCFLFAQAIGHVRPGAGAEGDTLAAHRLARARAEAIRARLEHAGLPATDVSSVWDRQFAIREPRVTLWIFSQTPGQDCAGTPLPGAAALFASTRPRTFPTFARTERAGDEPAPGIRLPASSMAAAIAPAPPLQSDPARFPQGAAEATPPAIAQAPVSREPVAVGGLDDANSVAESTPPPDRTASEVAPDTVAEAGAPHMSKAAGPDDAITDAQATPQADQPLGESLPSATVSAVVEVVAAPAADAGDRTHAEEHTPLAREVELIRADAALQAARALGGPEPVQDVGVVANDTVPSAAAPLLPAPARDEGEPFGTGALVAATTEPKAGPETMVAAIPAGPAPPQSIELVFAPDSSELTPEAKARLQGMLAALARDAVWEVELQAAVDDVAGALPADRALAYNQWLAELRQTRVEDWLGTRRAGPVMRIRRSLLPHDPSRRLVLKARAVP